MRLYSTCADCGKVLDVADPAFTTHPNCTEPDDPERDLADAWIDAATAGRDSEAAQLKAALDRPPKPPRMIDAALAYAAWGWAVFPLLPGSKTPATRHGFKDGSADTGVINAWWKSMPEANIGLPTGEAFDVIDVDAPAGYRSYLAMLDADVIPDVHGKVFTRSSGLHLYVTPTGERNSAGLMPGIDYRGNGGYVVAPPSIVECRRYEWMHKPSLVIKATAGGRHE
jgi:hypothetical protein